MHPELLHPEMRKRAIHPDELRFENGEAATKFSMQDVAWKAGLPVSPILSEGEVHHVLSNGISEEERIFLRGFYRTSDDMWQVDMLPTYRIGLIQALNRYTEQFIEESADPSIVSFIERNFGISHTPAPEYFFQLGDPGLVYFSTLTYGPYIFLTANNISMGRGVNWRTYDNGAYSTGDHWHYSNEYAKSILDLSRQTNIVFDRALVRKATPFEYKHDIIFSTKTRQFTLVQSRVASRKMTEQDLNIQDQWIDTMVASGIPVVDIEPNGIGILGNGHAPNESFILQLTNDTHKGSASREKYLSADLSHMVGLILPKKLRGGLLQHSGYGIMSIALYWGLPISFTA